ncbi:MAG: DUF935 family protein [Verrucomicrobiia bacterium]
MPKDILLYGADGSPIVRQGTVSADKPLIGSIVPDQLALRWYDTVSKNLDPVTLGAILDEAVSGAIERQFKLFEEIEEKWPDARLALYKHKLKVCRRSWTITPPDKPIDADLASAKADFGGREFGEIKDFSRTMFNLLDSVGKNLSACEIHWQVKGGGKGLAARVGIERIPWINYRHLAYDTTSPELMLIPDLLKIERVPFSNYPKKFIVFEHLTKSGHAARGGLLRPVAWAFMLYLFATKDWAALTETFGVDTAYAFYKEGASKEDQNAVLLHLQRIAIRAGVFPVGTDIHLERATGGGSGASAQEAAVKFYSSLVIKMFLGGSLSTQDAEYGTKAQSTVQVDDTDELVDWSGVLLAETMTDTALSWLIGFNFADPGDNPWFELPAAKRKDLTALANVINILVRLGVKIPERWARSECGDIPEPAEGEDILTPQAPLVDPAAAGAGSGASDFGEDGNVRRPQMGAATLTARALNFSTITELQAQAALDEIRAQAVRKGQDTRAFDQIAGPLKRLIARNADPKTALAELDATAKEIGTEKLAGVLEQVIILSDLIGRAVVAEQTGNSRQPSTHAERKQ